MRAASEMTGSRRGATLVATGLGLFMIYVDATIVNVALPDVQRHFGASESDLQWAVASYSLTMAMFMMAAGSVGDRVGRRATYVTGIAVFAGASILCASAPSILALNVARGFQGIGAAIVNVASLALVGAAFTDPASKAKAIGIWTGVASVGLVVGPTIGGFLTDAFGWRSVFVLNPLIGAVTVALTLSVVAESKGTTRRFDWFGQLLFMVTVGLLTFGLIQAPAWGWRSPMTLGCFVAATVGGLLFRAREQRVDEPMMDLTVFRDRAYTAALLAVFAVLFGIYGALLVITQYLQNVRGYSPQQAGLVLVAMTLPAVFLAPLAGSIVARFGPRLPTLCGLAAATVGLAFLAVTTGGSLAWTVVGLALLSIGAGLTLAPSTHLAMASIEPERSGMASGILSVQRALGSTAGFAIMGSVLAASVAAVLPGRFGPLLPDDAQRQAAVASVLQSAEPHGFVSIIGPAEPLHIDAEQVQQLLDAADEAFVIGTRVAMASGALLAGFAFAVGYQAFPRRRSDTSTLGAAPSDTPVPSRSSGESEEPGPTQRS